MKKYFALVFAILFAVSCSDSKDEAAGANLRDDASLLLGKWNTTWFSDVLYENGKKVGSERSKDDWFTFELFDDGTFQWIEEGDAPDTGTYVYNTTDHSLEIRVSDSLGLDFGLGAADKTEIKFLSATKMVIYMEHSSTEDGINYSQKRELSFRKVK